MASLFNILNRLLPFATPGTPIWQDVIHLAAICTLLYFAPQIQERIQASRAAANVEVQRGEVGNLDGQHADLDPDGADIYHDHQADPEDVGLEPNGHLEDDHDDHDDGEPDAANDHIEEGQAGPARVPIIPEQRNVGAKKAKALARRDQRRAYHEFQRSQGEAQRARDAEGAAERESAQTAERERRKAAEAALEAKKAKEREERRTREEAGRLEEQRRREQAIELVRSRIQLDRMCDLFKVAREVGVDDEEWVEKVLRSSGMLGRRGDTMTMITSLGWAVRVSSADMQSVYAQVLASDNTFGEDARVKDSYIGRILKATIQAV